MIAREVDDVTARKLQEGNIASDNGDDKIPSSKASSSANSKTTSWTRLKDPRIVRVSRAFGGKDRHSKVCTVRGLRDRRVRLSVPTAIQLYDLQDRLGLNQPSKVVDWLLNAAKHEIDELPPLQMPPTGNFNPNLHPILANYHGLLGAASNNSQSIKEGLNLNSNNSSSSNINWDDLPLEQSRSNSLNCLRSKSKDVITETTNDHHKDQNNCSLENHGHYHNNILHRSPDDHSYLPVPYSSFLKWDPSSLSLAQSGSTGIQQPDNFNGLGLPSTVSVQLGSQVVVHPQGFPQSFFHQHNISGASDGGQFDQKEINFQMLSSGSENPMSHSDSFRPSIDSTSQSVRPFHFLHSQNSTELGKGAQ